MPLIRAARLDDAPALGAVHVRAWQAGYQGIMPDAYLDALSAHERAAKWTATLGKVAADQSLWVAEVLGNVVGFAGGGPATHAPDAGCRELYVLNVDPGHWRQGVGHALLEAFETASRSAGATRLTLRVARDNARARAFYERRGWSWDGSVAESHLLGVDVVECRYGKTIG